MARQKDRMNRKAVLVNQHSASDTKIALFRSLFRGREDVYPRRFESLRTGKSGYAPACANEWIRGICEKSRIKCSDCLHRRFLPVTDDVVRCHLSGQDDSLQPFVAGVYPMLLDESCLFLAADFDKLNWQDDAASYMETCREMGLSPALERSRSGRGGHVWMFFHEAIPAALARRLGSHVLTETMERRPDVGLDSYDRFFPNQDTLPRGGFGNLIALPLQKEPRDRGNSLFLDDQMHPYTDQWSFLSTVVKIDRDQVETIVSDAERRGRTVGIRFPSGEEEGDEPWLTSPSRRRRDPPIVGELPATIELVMGNEIYIPTEGLVPGLRNRLLRLAAFQNPDFYKAQSMRLPTYDKARIIACAEEHPHHMALPRGCLEDVRDLLTSLKILPVIRDESCRGRLLDLQFQGQLRPDQQIAARAMVREETGVLAATTAFGKTVIAAWLIAERGVNTLVLVHRRQLLDQWVERLSAFLDVEATTIGRIGGGRRKPTGLLDVALIQSLVRKGVVDDVVGEYGHLIVDECHHLPARSFEQVARRAKAQFVVGLSATITRKDGHHPIIFMQCGPVRYRANARDEARKRPFSHTVIVRPTSFQPMVPMPAGASDKRVEFHTLYDELINDDSRNQQICDDVVEAVADGRSPLVLTERTEHVDHLVHRLSGRVGDVIALKGGMGRKRQRETAVRLADIPQASDRVIVATGRYLGEGFDDARLDTLFLTLPVSWHGTVAQYVGRLHRLREGKNEVRVYDYADLNSPMLARMFDRRCRGYENVGYSIVLPASAVPGWPADVPLPPEPKWKSDYAASIQRLVRDGLDQPLANLFVHAAVPAVSQQDHTSGARSASEAFLYRRLETLNETKGRFLLNAQLPIPFDGRGGMEVDLLCEDVRIALELDGAQHLDDAAAYRRDRRKDILLQENGYMVLRFLAEDLAKNLDSVLDTILRSLARRREGL